jgi:hypothetical protein
MEPHQTVHDSQQRQNPGLQGRPIMRKVQPTSKDAVKQNNVSRIRRRASHFR